MTALRRNQSFLFLRRGRKPGVLRPLLKLQASLLGGHAATARRLWLSSGRFPGPFLNGDVFAPAQKPLRLSRQASWGHVAAETNSSPVVSTNPWKQTQEHPVWSAGYTRMLRHQRAGVTEDAGKVRVAGRSPAERHVLSRIHLTRPLGALRTLPLPPVPRRKEGGRAGGTEVVTGGAWQLVTRGAPSGQPPPRAVLTVHCCDTVFPAVTLCSLL